MNRLLMIFGFVVMVAIAHAAQIKTVKNYEEVSINASIKEPNNLILEDDRIQEIKAPGNTLIDACNGKTSCKLIDDLMGVLTFLPATLYHTRPFTINLYTEKGFFYNVHVEPKPIPSQTIVFKSPQTPVLAAHAPHASNYEMVLLLFLSALMHDTLPEGFTQNKNPAIYKAPKTTLKRLRTLTGNQLHGEIFELKNTTKKPLSLKESWFNWAGTKGVALAKNHLAPLETTRVYRIS